jgi:hypothetical protein
MAIEKAESDSQSAPVNGRVESLTWIGRQIDIAVGKGSIACSSIGGVNEEPTCATGGDTVTTDRR